MKWSIENRFWWGLGGCRPYQNPFRGWNFGYRRWLDNSKAFYLGPIILWYC